MATCLKILIFAALGVVVCQVLVFGIRARINPLGKPPIPRPAFYLAKLCMCVSIFLLGLEAAIGNPQLPLFAILPFVSLLLGGTFLFAFGFAELGKNLRVGLPDEVTTLVTSGAYRWSRNPLYVSLFCLFGASLIYAFSWLNLSAVALGVILHHRIVLAEETFLRGKFKEFDAYAKKVRRYL
jgi:protein-S-isoprenylcysteine O-methyltransferase Ste14